MDKQITISVDQENSAEDWWTAALAADKTELPLSCLVLTHEGVSSVTVSQKDADAFQGWGAALPGWNDGPEYAPNPFVFDPAT